MHNFVNQLRQARDSANPEHPCLVERSVSGNSVHRQRSGKQPKTRAKRLIHLLPKVSGISGSFYDPQRTNDPQRQTRDLRPASDLQRQPPGSLASRRQRQRPACAANDCDPPKLQHSQRNLQDPRPAKRPSLAWPANKSALQCQPRDFRPGDDLQRQPPGSFASKPQHQLSACASKRVRSAKPRANDLAAPTSKILAQPNVNSLARKRKR